MTSVGAFLLRAKKGGVFDPPQGVPDGPPRGGYPPPTLGLGPPGVGLGTSLTLHPSPGGRAACPTRHTRILKKKKMIKDFKNVNFVN